MKVKGKERTYLWQLLTKKSGLTLLRCVKLICLILWAPLIKLKIPNSLYAVTRFSHGTLTPGKVDNILKIAILIFFASYFGRSGKRWR